MQLRLLFCKNNTSKCKIKVVLYYKESTKEMKKNAQKIHSLFIIIETQTVKTHKKTVLIDENAMKSATRQYNFVEENGCILLQNDTS